MTSRRYWVVEDDWRTAEQISDLLATTMPFSLNEQKLFTQRKSAFYRTRPTGDYRNPVIPLEFPPPELRFPEHGLAPDYFHLGPVHLVSRRLRDALAQSASDMQYLPIKLISAGADIRAQDYRWINTLACHPAIDPQLSIYKMDEGTRTTTGETFRFIRSYNRMVVRDDIPLNAEIFRVAEDLTTVLASDALAERVMRAGCTGISFEDPATARSLGPIHRYRTATGVIEEDMNQVFPESP